MRLGAVIIVAIGVCIASLILFTRSSAPQLQAFERAAKNMQNSKLGSYSYEDRERFRDARSSFEIFYVIMWLFHLVVIIVAIYCFFKVSVRRSGLPCDEPLRRCEHLLRLRALARWRWQPEPLRNCDGALVVRSHPFQFGTLTLLALMTAVAIICAANRYPLGN